MHLQIDYDLVDYVAQLREGILEAYTGIVTGFKNTEKGMSLLKDPCIVAIFDLALYSLCVTKPCSDYT